MPLILLLFLQAAAAPPANGSIQSDFDLGKYDASASCTSRGPSDIVICGRRRADRNRVYPLTGEFEAQRVVARMGVGGKMKAAAELEDVSLSAGQISHRMMVRLKMPF